MFTGSDLKIVEFCANECRIQQSGEMSVARMVAAWHFATQNGICNTPPFSTRPITVTHVLALGSLIDPGKNSNGFRQQPVRIGHQILDNQGTLSSQVVNLCEYGSLLSPEEFFETFEEIHPFLDGNGRVGQILFNWRRGTLHDPEMAPDFWGSDRRN